MQKPQFNPAAVSREYEAVRRSWDLVAALMGGTETMREAGEMYLPRYEREVDAAYTARRNSSVLYGAFAQAVDGVVSRVFAEPVILKQNGADALFEAHASDIDGLGTNLDTFARRAFEAAVIDGVAWLFIDFPKIDPEVEEEFEGKTFKRPRTAADDLDEGVRPYWRLYPAASVPGVEFGKVGNRFGITRIRFADMLTRVDPDTFDEVLVERVRVTTPTDWQVYERRLIDVAASPADDHWKLVDEGSNSLGFVPVVPIALGRYHSPYWARPPFIDLAFLNLRHWQSYSDQTNILAKSRFAMLACKGAVGAARADAAGNPKADGVLAVGPSTVLTSSEAGSWYYVEPTGSGAAHGWQDLDRLEEKMVELSLRPLLAQQVGRSTATAVAIQRAQANSEVQAWALTLKDALEQAWVIHALWLGFRDGAEPQVEVNTDYGLSLGASEMADLIKMRALGELSQRTLWMEAKRRAILSPTFDPDVEEAQIASEGPAPGTESEEPEQEAA